MSMAVPPLAGPTVGARPVNVGCGASRKLARATAGLPTLSIACASMTTMSSGPEGAGAVNWKWQIVAAVAGGTVQVLVNVVVAVATVASSDASCPAPSS